MGSSIDRLLFSRLGNGFVKYDCHGGGRSQVIVLMDLAHGPLNCASHRQPHDLLYALGTA
ncbi:hypothetical protein D3C76_1730010 [compost metagenome]